MSKLIGENLKKAILFSLIYLPLQIWSLGICNHDISKGITARNFKLKACTHDQTNFAYMQVLHTYASLARCTHLLTYAKFARMQKLENLHLPQTKCKSHFEFMQILHIYATLVKCTESKICTREYLVNNAEYVLL